MTSPLWLPTTRRQRSSVTATSGVRWILAIVVGLSWPATPTCALHFFNVSSSKSTEEQLSPSTASRCAPVSHDVLWTRLKLAAPRLTLPGSSNDDDDDDVELSRTHRSPIDNYQSSPSGEFHSLISDISQTVATSTISRHRQHTRRRRRRRWRRRERSERRRKQGGEGRRRSAPTSWSCRLQKRWKRMPRDVFPGYIQTGSCRRQKTCMFGMYACRPRRYIINVLRRISAVNDSDSGCRPVPVIGPDVVYEEAWSLVDVPVTVACECSRRRRSGTYHRTPTDAI